MCRATSSPSTSVSIISPRRFTSRSSPTMASLCVGAPLPAKGSGAQPRHFTPGFVLRLRGLTVLLLAGTDAFLYL